MQEPLKQDRLQLYLSYARQARALRDRVRRLRLDKAAKAAREFVKLNQHQGPLQEAWRHKMMGRLYFPTWEAQYDQHRTVSLNLPPRPFPRKDLEDALGELAVWVVRLAKERCKNYRQQLIEAVDRLLALLPDDALRQDKSLVGARNDARDRWIYEQCCAGVPYKKIIGRLNQTIASQRSGKWRPICSVPGLRAAASKCAERHGLDPIPRRQDL
jgi:hypothetical protein